MAQAYSPYGAGGQSQYGLIQSGDSTNYSGNIQSSYANTGGTVNGAQAGGYFPNGWNQSSTFSGPNAAQTDPDAEAYAEIGNEEAQARAGLNPGVSYSADDALESMYGSRIGVKNTLGQDIANAPGLLGSQLGQDQAVANQQIGQGVQNTRYNYNSRGLLYSGLEQGGENQVRSQGALALEAQEASDVSQAQQAQTQYRAMYNQVDLNSQAQNLQLATQAVNIGLQNQTARSQALQQFGGGIGQGAGAIVGGLTSNNPAPTPTSTNPTAGWQPQQLTMPNFSSQWGYDPSNPNSSYQTAQDWSLDSGGLV